MNKIDITKIAVKFDPENTTKELFDSVVNKWGELGYCGSLEYADIEDLLFWTMLVLDEEGVMIQIKPWWERLPQYTVMSPHEFLTLENEYGAAPVSSDNNTIIVEWLNKLEYVLLNDQTTGGFVDCTYSEIRLPTDFGDIRGSEEVVKFVNHRYGELATEENTEKQTELETKREQLLAELAEIDKQLGK